MIRPNLAKWKPEKRDEYKEKMVLLVQILAKEIIEIKKQLKVKTPNVQLPCPHLEEPEYFPRVPAHAWAAAALICSL